MQTITDPKNIDNLICYKYWENHTPAIEVTEYPITLTYQNQSHPEASSNWHTPSAVLFYSDDQKLGEPGTEDPRNGYKEFSIVRSDAYGTKTAAKAFQYESTHLPEWESWPDWLSENKNKTTCTMTAVRYGRYVLVRLENAGMIVAATTTLPENAPEKVYVSITGELCTMTDFSLSRETEAIGPGTIEPDEDDKSFILSTVGDIPNVDCSGWWLEHSDGIMLTDVPQKITYHTISYPRAKEVWHAPLVVVFSSLDKLVNGVAYTEYSVTRNDGFGWKTDASAFECSSELDATYGSAEKWLATNKAGVECTLTAYREENVVFLKQECAGLTVSSRISLPFTTDLPVCVSLSGELCAISNIRIEYEY